MRSFYAVTLEHEVHAPLRRFLRGQENILSERKGQPKIRWVRPDNLHVTLKFLGEVPPTELPFLNEAGRQAAATISSFQFSFAGFINLGQRKKAVICLEIETCPSIALLTEALGDALAARGYERTKRDLRAHVTLARTENLSRTKLREIRKELELLELPSRMEVRDFALTRSNLRPSGPTYTVLERFELA